MVFQKVCSCGKACQFLALQGTSYRSYLGKLTIDNKYINKRFRLFIYPIISLKRVDKKKLLGRNN